MNATDTHALSQSEKEWALHGAERVSFTEAIGAVGAVVLAVVGLAGILPQTLAAIATIVVGAAILMEGRTTASRSHSTVSRVVGEMQPLSGGLTVEFIGGVAGIVLGILALFGTHPETLLAAAVIVFGATLLLAGAALAQWTRMMEFRLHERVNDVGRDAAMSSGGETLIGLGAIVLGILGVIGLEPLTLILVGLLSLGVAVLYNGVSHTHRTMALDV